MKIDSHWGLFIGSHLIDCYFIGRCWPIKFCLLFDWSRTFSLSRRSRLSTNHSALVQSILSRYIRSFIIKWELLLLLLLWWKLWLLTLLLGLLLWKWSFWLLLLWRLSSRRFHRHIWHSFAGAESTWFRSSRAAVIGKVRDGINTGQDTLKTTTLIMPLSYT